MFSRLCAATLVGALLAAPSVVSAQPAPGGPGGRSGGGRGFDDVKTQLRATDEEWKVIGPKIQKVVATRQALDSSRRVMGGGPGGFGGPGGPFGGGPSSFRGPGAFGGPGGFGGPPPGGFGMFFLFQPLNFGVTGGLWGLGGPFLGAPVGMADPFFGGPPRGGRGGFGGPPSGGPGSSGGPPSGGPGAVGGPPSGGPGSPGGPPSGGRGGPGGPPPGGPGGFGDPLAQVRTDLQTVLDDPKSSAQDIQEKITALRQGREKLKADLAAAQKDLLELLTSFQEAVLVCQGYLD